MSHHSAGVPEATAGGRASRPEPEEDQTHFLPCAGDHSVPLHVPDCLGFPRGRVGR